MDRIMLQGMYLSPILICIILGHRLSREREHDSYVVHNVLVKTVFEHSLDTVDVRQPHNP